MNTDKQKIITYGGQGLLLLIMAIFLYVYLQSTQEYTYFYREQNQLLQWDTNFLQKMILSIGGFNKFLGQAVVQFFVVPKMGAILTTLLCLTSAHFLWGALKTLTNLWWLVPLAFVPTILNNVYLLDNYVHYDSLTALVLLSFFFWVHTLLCGANYWLHLALTTIIALTLFYLGGSIAVPFAFTVLVYEIFTRIKQSFFYLIPLGLVVFAGVYSVNHSMVSEMDQALWTAGFVDYFFDPTTLYSYSWLSIFALIPICRILGKMDDMHILVEGGLSLTMTAAICYGFHSMSQAHQDKNMYQLQHVITLARNQQWDQIINMPYDQMNNLISMNYRNLALSEKGQLLDRLFRIPQANNSQSLFLDYQQYTDIGVLKALTYYHLGVIGASQMMAVSANMSVTDGCPSMIQMTIKNYLITGQYNLAEKYIVQLENSWYYADWAKGMRKYLYNDQEVENDPELGQKRKDLPLDNEYFAIYAGLMNDCITILDANPAEKPALDYLVAYLLLEKNFNYIKPFVEMYYQRPWLNPMPERLQEAILTYAEKDMDYAHEHGVSDEMIAKFAQFRQDALQLRHAGGSKSKLAPKYGDTFWYSMLKGK